MPGMRIAPLGALFLYPATGGWAGDKLADVGLGIYFGDSIFVFTLRHLCRIKINENWPK